MTPEEPESAALTVVAPASLATLEALAQQAEDLAQASLSPATRRAYLSAWDTFEVWCLHAGLQSLPARPETVCMYLAHLAPTKSVRTVGKVLAAVALAHRTNNHPSPTEDPRVRLVARGLRRTHGKPVEQKEPILVADLAAMVRDLGDDPLGLRDRALLLLGWAGAFRRSEIVALDVEHIRETTEGLIIHLNRSKTDQEGDGRHVAIPRARRPELCPVAAFNAWVTAAGITSGPLFRAVDRWGHVHQGRLSDRAVALAVQRMAKRVGLDPATVAGHSLRAGFCTEAGRAGVAERAIMRQTGHRSAATLRGYIRAGTIFLDHPGADLL